MADHEYYPFKDSNAILHDCGGRTNICNSLLLYGSGDKPMSGSSVGKSWFDAQHTMTDVQPRERYSEVFLTRF